MYRGKVKYKKLKCMEPLSRTQAPTAKKPSYGLTSLLYLLLSSELSFSYSNVEHSFIAKCLI